MHPAHSKVTTALFLSYKYILCVNVNVLVKYMFKKDKVITKLMYNTYTYHHYKTKKKKEQTKTYSKLYNWLTDSLTDKNGVVMTRKHFRLSLPARATFITDIFIHIIIILYVKKKKSYFLWDFSFSTARCVFVTFVIRHLMVKFYVLKSRRDNTTTSSVKMLPLRGKCLILVTTHQQKVWICFVCIFSAVAPVL